MQRLTSRLIIAVITFCLGVAAVLIWLSYHNHLARKPSNIPSVVADTALNKKAPEQFYKPISIRQHSEYQRVLAALQDYVTRYGKAKTNTIYISLIYRENGVEWVSIYLKEDRSLMQFFLPLTYGDEAISYDSFNSHRLDLNKDVVATDKDIAGSSFLVTKEWARETIRDCMLNGDKFVLHK